MDAELQSQINEAAERAALKTMDVLFLHLGIDVNDPEELRALRERFEFLKRMHRGAVEVSSTARKAVVRTCVGALASGLIALVVMRFKGYSPF